MTTELTRTQRRLQQIRQAIVTARRETGTASEKLLEAEEQLTREVAALQTPDNLPKSLTDPIEEIAREHLDIETLETQNIGERDFHEVAVWQLRKALQAAYIAGSEARGRLEESTR